MLKKTIVILIMTAVFLCAQGNRSNGQFQGFDKGYISGTYNLYPSFISEINDEVKEFGAGEFDRSVFLYGGEICGNANSAFGIGVHYFTGSDLVQKIVEIDSLKLDRSVSYRMSFFGLTVNYRKSIFGSFEYFGSFNGSYGSIELILSQDYGDQSFGDVWDSFDPGSYIYDYNRSVNYSSDLFVFGVNNGLRMFLSSRIAVGITIGYTYGFVSDNGEINNGFESIKNVPDLDFEGMNYGLGIYFGY